MKKLLYILAFGLLASYSVNAQDNGRLYGLYNNIFAQQSMVGMPNQLDWAFYLPMNIQVSASLSNPYYHIWKNVDSDQLFKKILNNAGDEEYGIIDTYIDLFGFGFSVNDMYFGLGMGLNTVAEFSTPSDLFSFPFKGNYNPSSNSFRDVSFNNFRVDAYTIADVSAIYSMKVNDELTVGAKAKLLFAENVTARFRRFSIKTNPDSKNFGYKYDINYDVVFEGLRSGYSVANALDSNEPKAGSYSFGDNMGFAVDLGATYKWREFDFYASIENLGYVAMDDRSEFIHYEGTTEFKGLSISSLNLGNVGDQVKNIIEDKKDEANKAKSLSTNDYHFELPMTFNLGAIYKIAEINKFGIFSENKFFRSQNFFNVQPFYLLDLWGWMQTKIGYNISNRVNSDIAFGLHVNAGMQFSLDIQNPIHALGEQTSSASVMFGIAYGDFFKPTGDEETQRKDLMVDAPSIPVQEITDEKITEKVQAKANHTQRAYSDGEDKEEAKEVSNVTELVEHKSKDAIDPSVEIEKMEKKETPPATTESTTTQSTQETAAPSPKEDAAQ